MRSVLRLFTRAGGALLLCSTALAAPPDAAPSSDRVGPALWNASSPRSEEVFAVQVLLDRRRHSPGAIDGLMGSNTRRAIRAFQRQQGLSAAGKITPELLASLRQGPEQTVVRDYAITVADADRRFVDVPSSMTGKAELEKVAYERPSEALAEKFHMSEAALVDLNPGASFDTAGTVIRVAGSGREHLPETVKRIEVDKRNSAVRAYGADGQLLASYPATVGSATFPSPEGAMEVRAVAPAPAYYFNPEGRSWGPDHHLTIAPGPNNPVGSTWIDLSKPGYGIHGTPDPSLIGKTASHGCVRLTNWDAEELGAAVEPGTVVEFL